MPEVETRRLNVRGEVVESHVRTDERARVRVERLRAGFSAVSVESAARERPLLIQVTDGEARGLSEALRVLMEVPTEDETRYRRGFDQAQDERNEARKREIGARTDAIVAERNIESLVLAIFGIGKAIGVLRDDLPGITGPEALHFANDIEGEATRLRAEVERIEQGGAQPHIITALTCDHVGATAPRPHPLVVPIGPFPTREAAAEFAEREVNRYGGGTWTTAPLHAPTAAEDDGFPECGR